MTGVADHTETDIRERILLTAERLFREIGYTKTTVADIAKHLRMSPANVYRFFDSKKAIHEGVARRLMGEVEAAALAITQKQGLPAADKLRELLAAVHRMNSERYVDDSKMHEMVAVAMVESWDVCIAHMQCIIGSFATVIAEGVEKGEFHVADVPTAAMCTCSSLVSFFHPQLIAEKKDMPGPTLEQQIEFAISSLSYRPAR
ncbi:TetR/AcrR family transcriptional regulator [Pseudolabrys taiwanensis]|uniref:TetR/AcrR family transcriptional regulator n=1 Tax=Pseudolabrys taiwanensis TaxID=331696 RepID=A0A345ZVI7_9HYPH|nr:TetR/AcrR family transcriptional regulator [Pseudolabrys taiwanensis]AXK80934.1 TetR/AcrR family transcriptional regulator [Pseudolabrys taiwanensis]